MKLKKLGVFALAATMVFSLSACSKKEGNANQKEGQKVEQNEDIEGKLNELTKKENEIFEKHKGLWEKAFSKADKADVEASKEMAYEDFLASLVEKVKGDLKEEEVKSLEEDLEAIKASGRENIKVVGFDATDDAVKAVEAGELAATIAQQPKLMGEKAVETAMDVLNGKEVVKSIPVELQLIVKK